MIPVHPGKSCRENLDRMEQRRVEDRAAATIPFWKSLGL
jgi:hypothetical protein